MKYLHQEEERTGLTISLYSRDFQIGYDSNARIRSDMVRDLLIRLKDAGWLNAQHAKQHIDKLAFEALTDTETEQGPLARAMVSDIIEYGRMVHAEMNALTDAARFGRSTQNGTLYCTVMPCHLCTKLIISSGISEVQFLQPYYKSLIKELYEDSVSIDEEGDGKVLFKPFRGVTPNGFRMIFEKGKRKGDGDEAAKWQASEAQPIFTTDIPTYLSVETKLNTDLEAILKKISNVRNPLAV